MFMGDDSSLKGCGFESRHHILDGNFFALICCTSYIVCSKKTENKLKEAWVGPFKKRKAEQARKFSVSQSLNPI